MIKYVEFDSIDETGQHITPVNSLYQMNKIASGTYSPEIMKVIFGMQKNPNRYDVVINALGSYEVWGNNRNGDAFPEAALTHLSLRTDMGTAEDYGYKTFEYYAKWFRNHVNKPTSPNFGEVIYSHWNPVIHRVELIVGIDVVKDAETVQALENGDLVSVSMGCFTDPEYPISTINGYKPIKDIVVGDIVWTHKKQWKKVTELHRRVYTGELCNIDFCGLPIETEITADHPLMVKLFQAETNAKDRAYIHDEEFEAVKFGWAHANHIEKMDHVEYTYPEYKDACSIGDVDLAKLMGYYIAEGSFCYNGDVPCTVQLSCHVNDDLPKEVPILMRKMFGDITCEIHPRRNSQKSLSVNIQSTEVASFLYKYVGRTSHKKFIPAEIFVSNKEIKLAFLGAWLSGDGWCDAKGVHWSSCNINLLLQARDLLMSLGIPTSIYKITHKAGSGFNSKDTIEFTLNASHYDVECLIPYSIGKLSGLKDIISERQVKGRSSIRFNSDGTYSYRVKDVTKRYVDNVQTYNFEVEDDASYSAAGLVSHNCKVPWDECSICGNKAKIRKEYCIHAQNYLGEIVTEEMARKWSIQTGKKILPGMQVFVWNWKPRFFDISKVFIGADRTSYVLGKAASKKTKAISSLNLAEAYGITDSMIDKAATVKKQGEIDKVIGDPPDDMNGVVTKPGSSIITPSVNEKINNTIVAEPVLPREFLDGIANTRSLPSIFSTMLGMGIFPKPTEVQRIVLVSIGKKPIADALDANNEVFDYNSNEEPLNIPDRFDDSLSRILAPFLAERSACPHFMLPRMEYVDKQASLNKYAFYSSTMGNDYWIDPNPQIGLPKPSIISPTTGALAGIAALYAGLKAKSLGIGPEEMANIFVNKPWLAALIGGGVMYGIYRAMLKNQSLESMAPASAYEGVLQDTNFTGHIKAGVDVKSFKGATRMGRGIAAGLIAFPVAYFANAINQKSIAETGYPRFPSLQNITPTKAAIGAGAATALAPMVWESIKKSLQKK